MATSQPRDWRELLAGVALGRGALASVFGDFCRVAACCLALQTREEEYLEVAGRYSGEELELFGEALASLVLEMERHPFEDMLGPHYQSVASKGTRDTRGEFYTPRPISLLMARMLFDAGKLREEGRAVPILEPACGAGGMVLAIAELLAPAHVGLIRATCWDLSPVAADMCYVNLTLWGIPARIVWGDTLSHSVHGSWKNVHWARVGEDTRRLLEGIAESSTQEETVELPGDRGEYFRRAFEQMDLGL